VVSTTCTSITDSPSRDCDGQPTIVHGGPMAARAGPRTPRRPRRRLQSGARCRTWPGCTPCRAEEGRRRTVGARADRAAARGGSRPSRGDGMPRPQRRDLVVGQDSDQLPLSARTPAAASRVVAARRACGSSAAREWTSRWRHPRWCHRSGPVRPRVPLRKRLSPGSRCRREPSRVEKRPGTVRREPTRGPLPSPAHAGPAAGGTRDQGKPASRGGRVR